MHKYVFGRIIEHSNVDVALHIRNKTKHQPIGNKNKGWIITEIIKMQMTIVCVYFVCFCVMSGSSNYLNTMFSPQIVMMNKFQFLFSLVERENLATTLARAIGSWNNLQMNYSIKITLAGDSLMWRNHSNDRFVVLLRKFAVDNSKASNIN